jgi:hypothetical protein
MVDIGHFLQKFSGINSRDVYFTAVLQKHTHYLSENKNISNAQ